MHTDVPRLAKALRHDTRFNHATQRVHKRVGFSSETHLHNTMNTQDGQPFLPIFSGNCRPPQCLLPPTGSSARQLQP